MSWLNKKFFSLFYLKKKNIFFVLFFALWGVFLPGRHAFAAWYDFVISAVTFIPMVAIGVVLVVAVLLSSLLSAFSGEILTWVTGPSFISATPTWSYTKNPIIDIGLNITQPFVNMILVLVLVFIALATILRLAGYEVKKLLPTFVLVALLVNFSPVICGLIVDASNIVMNFFLSEITGGKQLISMLDSVGDTIVGMVGNWANFRADQNVPLLLMLAVSVVVNLGLFLILLLFAFIFMARYLAIWILVILSPLAFACYILPATRKFWNLWWSQFIQWSIIGITMGFFLYLADQFATLNPTQATSAGGIGGAILPALVPLVFLYLGFTFGLATGAMGAPMVLGLTKKSGKWIGGKTWTGAKNWAEETGRTREAAGKAVQAIERVPGLRAFIPQKAREYGQFRPAIDEAQKKAAFQSSPELAHRMATGADYGVKAVANMMEIINRGDSQDLFTAFKNKHKVDKDEDLYKIPEFQDKMSRYLQIALKGGQHAAILRSDPRLARFAPGANIPGYEGLNHEQAVSKAVNEARSQHVAKWERETLDDKAVLETSMERGQDFWQSVAKQVKKGHQIPETVGNSFKEFIASNEKYKGKTLSQQDALNAWGDFRKDFKQKHNGQEGFFMFVDTPYAKREGWSKNKIIRAATGVDIPEEEATTPGAAAGLARQAGATQETPYTKQSGGSKVNIKMGNIKIGKAGNRTRPTPPSSQTPGKAAGIEIITPIGAKKRTEEEIEKFKKIREEESEKKPPRGRGGVGV